MSDGMSIDIGQFTDAIKELREIPRELKAGLIRDAAKESIKKLHGMCVEKAPVMAGPEQEGMAPPGNLKRSIYYFRIPEECSDRFEVWKVDVRKGKGRRKGQSSLLGAYYASWVEHGHFTRPSKSALDGLTGTRDQKRSKLRESGTVKWVSPRPFMDPAFRAWEPISAEIMQQYMERNLPAVLARFKYLKAWQGATRG